MKVLVIPEDPTYDQYILKPIVERLFRDIERPARIEVLQDPRLGGVARALDAQRLGEIVHDNPMVSLFLLIVDRDCNRFDNEAKAAARAGEHPGRCIASVAWQEVETWMLALHRDALPDPWSVVRAECDPRERYALPLLEDRGWDTLVGKGYKRAMRDLGAAWNGVLQVCPELNELRERLRAWSRERPA